MTVDRQRGTGGRQTGCRVIAEYRAAYPEPLVVRAGEELAVSDRESEWPGWLWCTSQSGVSGWMPDLYLECRGGTCVALCDYDATELSVHVGEELFPGQEVRGWIWCTNREGRAGWVPAENLAFEPDPPAS